MGPYEVEVHGVKVNVSVSVVAEDDRLIVEKLRELRTLLKRGVVGVDVKMLRDKVPSVLLLCVEGHCLIIPSFFCWLIAGRPTRVSETELKELLSDRTICFVASNLGRLKDMTDHPYSAFPYDGDLSLMIVNTVVELGHLAAMVLKKPSLQKKGLHELSGEIGMNIKPVSGTCSDLGANIFSEEEIRYLVYDVYASYLIGDKLLKML
ncbi:hypothetical protein ACLB2K_060801 [Fragaria x ananassa]